jgi:hypothetical protein
LRILTINDEAMGREAEGDEAETRAVKTVCDGRTEIYGCVAHHGAREWYEEKAKAHTLGLLVASSRLQREYE